MIRACDLKRGSIVSIGNAPHVVEDIVVQTPSARGGATLYKVRFRNVRTKSKVDNVYRGDDALQEASFERREVQYLYRDTAGLTFMDLSDYSQFTLPDEELGDEESYLVDGMENIFALISEGRVLGIELPPVVELTVTETGPAIKGASATARTKPATLETGLVVKVPEYLEKGECVRVDTRTGEYLSRA
jgi:elongation factor P